jgi:hypothetical protein
MAACKISVFGRVNGLIFNVILKAERLSFKGCQKFFLKKSGKKAVKNLVGKKKGLPLQPHSRNKGNVKEEFFERFT